MDKFITDWPSAKLLHWGCTPSAQHPVTNGDLLFSGHVHLMHVIQMACGMWRKLWLKRRVHMFSSYHSPSTYWRVRGISSCSGSSHRSVRCPMATDWKPLDAGKSLAEIPAASETWQVVPSELNQIWLHIGSGHTRIIDTLAPSKSTWTCACKSC